MNSKKFTVSLLPLALSAALAVGEHNSGDATSPVGGQPTLPLHAGPGSFHHASPEMMGQVMEHLHDVMATAQAPMGEAGGMDHGSMNEMPGLDALAGEEFEQAFIAMMIAHHQGALEMAEWLLANGSDQRVRSAAEEVIEAQEVEIELMTGWLREWYGQEPASEWLEAMTRDMTVMMEAMEAGSDPDRAFLEEMIGHHQGAIDMAQVALERAEHAELRELARDVIVVQAQEVHAYAELLRATPAE